MKPTGKAKGGHARAKKLAPERRQEIARAAAALRWDKRDEQPAMLRNLPVQHVKNKDGTLRDQIAFAVLTGLYSNLPLAREFVIQMFGTAMPLMEGFTRIAYAQADECLRLRTHPVAL